MDFGLSEQFRRLSEFLGRVSGLPGRTAEQFRRVSGKLGRLSEWLGREAEELGGASERFRRATEGSRLMTTESRCSLRCCAVALLRCCAVALFSGETLTVNNPVMALSDALKGKARDLSSVLENILSMLLAPHRAPETGGQTLNRRTGVAPVSIFQI